MCIRDAELATVALMRKKLYQMQFVFHLMRKRVLRRRQSSDLAAAVLLLSGSIVRVATNNPPGSPRHARLETSLEELKLLPKLLDAFDVFRRQVVRVIDKVRLARADKLLKAFCGALALLRLARPAHACEVCRDARRKRSEDARHDARLRNAGQ